MRGIENNIPFEKALMDDAKVRGAMSDQELKAALDPTTYVGLAPEIVDDVLAAAELWLK